MPIFRDYKRLLRLYSNDYMRRSLEKLTDHQLIHQVGGEQLECIHLNVSVESFSTYSESLTAAQLMEFLTDYYTAVFDATYKSGAFVNSVEGEYCEIVFFVEGKVTNERAIDLLFEIQRKVDSLLESKHERIAPGRFVASLFSGTTVFYNIGTADRMFIQSMGNTKNFAYRLNGINKNYGTRALTTDSSIFESKHVAWRILDSVRVVGIVNSLRLVEPIQLRGRTELAEAIRFFNLGGEAQAKREWNHAIDSYSRVLQIAPDDRPSHMMKKRCEQFLAEEPKSDWDGVYRIVE